MPTWPFRTWVLYVLLMGGVFLLLYAFAFMLLTLHLH